jgi:hypothetical protein
MKFCLSTEFILYGLTYYFSNPYWFFVDSPFLSHHRAHREHRENLQFFICP